ncbi:O-antigen ligase domain-containing protein [Alteromonas pelagimontana]|uniref:O-antigen ligase domain-containing protein n=1 Tax=Alteromonas pelagimontana TaxID=1858656 RepID=A0A6M4MAK5_9ALTE|nr:O-antigen ligase family protein [Alteromonas pelagimontana]QJR80193.1 O-antigen ligase domain-containing protein [Alteromonas pelagimontana]
MFLLVKILFGLISAYLVYKTVSRRCNKYLAFAVLAVWLRYFLSAFHQITYTPIAAGFSINAIASIGIAFTGLLLLPPKVLSLRTLSVIYLFFAAIIVSGVINGNLVGLVNVMVKWVFFTVIAGALFMAIRKVGKDEVLRKLLVAFFLPVSLEIMSIILGEVKATEADGSTSYIGGYNHEAAFSMIIAAFVLTVGLIADKQIKYRGVLFTLGCVLLLLVNYRTSILAILPLTAFFIFNAAEAKIAQRHKPVFFITSIIGMGFVFLALSYTMQNRFADVFVFLSSWDDLIKAPAYYTEEEKDIFSARVYLWSMYINAYVNGDAIRMLIGYGPESWSGVFPKYAHNTYVSFLYEYGMIGLVCFLLAVGSFVKHSLKIKNKRFALMLFSSMVGFLIMNLATMPLWNIEGLILYAILIGNTIAPVRLPQAQETKGPEFFSKLVKL